MKIEDPAAFSHFMGNEIYLLASEKEGFQNLRIELTEVPEIAVSFKYLGDNKKNFLVLTNYKETNFIAPDHAIALESTLRRLGFEFDDLALVNTFYYPHIKLDDLVTFFHPVKILILGEAAKPFSDADFPFNQVHTFNRINSLFTYSFNEMMDNTEKKKIFWEQMKQL